MTPNDFLKIIQQETSPLDKIPDGWYCTEDLCKMWKSCKTIVQQKVKSGIELGYVTMRKFLVNKNGIRRIEYYQFHEKENNQKDNQRKVMENTNRPCRKNKRS
jgi:hypothetical protein